MHLKTRVLFLILICLTAMCWRKVKAIEPTVPTYTCEVDDAQELKKEVEYINTLDSDDYAIIYIMGSFGINDCLNFTSAAKKTIQGNGCTITFTGTSGSFISVSDGILYLKNGDNESTFTISGKGDDNIASDSFIQVRADDNSSPILNMYENVKICNFTADSVPGGGVRVYNNHTSSRNQATFNMYGGTIEYCKVNSGYVHGGAVAICGNGVFNMFGGTIQYCEASGSNGAGGAVTLEYYYNSAGKLATQIRPQFTMHKGLIYKNGAHQGGGVSVFDGTFTMKGGTIKENHTDSAGGGIVAYSSPSYDVIHSSFHQGIIEYYSGRVNIEGGAITNNHSTSDGGGIYTRNAPISIISINNAVITDNSCTGYGGGIMNYGADVVMESGILCNNHAVKGGDDVGIQKSRAEYDKGIPAVYGNLTIPSASGMRQRLKIENQLSLYSQFCRQLYA